MNKTFFVGIILTLFLSSCGNNSLKEFAQCINDSGAKFYGSFTCTECKQQKDFFAEYASALPYVECEANADNSQALSCSEAGIKATPTWIFKDGTYALGLQSFKMLSEKTSCPEPKIN